MNKLKSILLLLVALCGCDRDMMQRPEPDPKKVPTNGMTDCLTIATNAGVYGIQLGARAITDEVVRRGFGTYLTNDGQVMLRWHASPSLDGKPSPEQVKAAVDKMRSESSFAVQRTHPQWLVDTLEVQASQGDAASYTVMENCVLAKFPEWYAATERVRKRWRWEGNKPVYLKNEQRR